MKIDYVHFSSPDIKKEYDTVVALKNNPYVKMSQDDFDKMELEHMEKDRKNGYILSYEVVHK